MMMIWRMPSRDGRGPMIRPLLEEGEDAEDDEEEKEFELPVEKETITVPSVQTSDSVTVVTVNPTRPRQRLVRRSSSAVERITMPSVQEEQRDGGDKSLRPRFLQERSATTVHITPAVIDPSRVPRSKASAFLLDVLAKSKELSGPESRRASLEPLRHTPGVTNTLHYVPPQDVERGVPLRMAGGNSHRIERQLSIGPSSDSLNGGTPTGARKRRISASQEHMAAIVRALQDSKQQLHQQLDILLSVLRFITADERDDDGRRPVLKEMVDEGMIPELASIMREFRFNTGLQVCVMSILAALAEESPVYAYMMSEFNLEKLIQKTAAIHATQDRLILLASTLVHAIEDSKHSVNIPAYQAEKTAKFRRHSATYTGMVIAAITTKAKHSSVASPSSSAKSTTSQRQAGIVATEIARSRAFTKSASPCGPERDKINSAERQQQSFARELAPPTLSANYRLLFSQELKKSEVQPLQVAEIDRTDVMSVGNHLAKRDRPASSPSKKSLSLDLASRSLAAAIYSGGSMFVEPSPLAKRMPFRGRLSAAGVRKKLSAPKRIQRALTERLPPTHMSTSLSPTQRPAMPERSNHFPGETVEAESPVIDGTPIVNDELQESSKGEEEAEATAEEVQEAAKYKEKKGSEDDDEESYEDDFDTSGDDTDEDKKMPNRQGSTQIESDGELIDLLQGISVQDPEGSTSLTTSMSEKIDAATTIQRHVRGVLVRQPPRTASGKNVVQPPEKKTPRVANSGKSARRGSKSDGIKCKRIPLSARAHRQLQTQGYNTMRSETTRRGMSRLRPVAPVSLRKKSSNTTKALVQGGANGGAAFHQRNQEASNQLSNQAMSSQRRIYSPLKQVLATSTSEVEPEHKTQVVKEPPDPEALKQIQTLYAEGLQHHKENHLGLAIECYEKALAIPGGQDFASLHVNLGSALMAQNKFSEALESFELAKRIQPDNIKAIYNSSLALLHLERCQEAQRLLRRILELEPTHEKAIIALSHLPGSVRSPTPKLVAS